MGDEPSFMQDEAFLRIALISDRISGMTGLPVTRDRIGTELHRDQFVRDAANKRGRSIEIVAWNGCHRRPTISVPMRLLP